MGVRKNASQLSLNVHLPESHPQEVTVRKHHQDVDIGQIGKDIQASLNVLNILIIYIFGLKHPATLQILADHGLSAQNFSHSLL